MKCVECDETITNPICPDCLAEGIACWVGERLGPRAASAVFDVTEVLAYRQGSTKCIKCHAPIGLCTYCYTNALIDIMKQNPAVLAQFIFYFDLERVDKHLKIID